MTWWRELTVYIWCLPTYNLYQMPGSLIVTFLVTANTKLIQEFILVNNVLNFTYQIKRT